MSRRPEALTQVSHWGQAPRRLGARSHFVTGASPDLVRARPVVARAGRARTSDVAILQAALFEVSLVILLGAIERAGGDDLGGDRPGDAAGGFEPPLRVIGLGLLLVILV